jgi:predicted protein tyrosine phosphatase
MHTCRRRGGGFCLNPKDGVIAGRRIIPPRFLLLGLGQLFFMDLFVCFSSWLLKDKIFLLICNYIDIQIDMSSAKKNVMSILPVQMRTLSWLNIIMISPKGKTGSYSIKSGHQKKFTPRIRTNNSCCHDIFHIYNKVLITWIVLTIIILK